MFATNYSGRVDKFMISEMANLGIILEFVASQMG